MFEVTEIYEVVQGSLGSIKATKKRKLNTKVRQDDRNDIEHTLSPSKYCEEAGTNLLSQTCELSQRMMLSTHKMNSILLQTTDDQLILDSRIKYKIAE